MKRKFRNKIGFLLLPALILILGPGNILVCKMGMDRCGDCCPRMSHVVQVDLAQVTSQQACCAVISQSVVATASSTPKNKELFSKQNHNGEAPFLNVASLMKRPHHVVIQLSSRVPPSSLPIYLSKKSLLI